MCSHCVARSAVRKNSLSTRRKSQITGMSHPAGRGIGWQPVNCCTRKVSAEKRRRKEHVSGKRRTDRGQRQLASRTDEGHEFFSEKKEQVWAFARRLETRGRLLMVWDADAEQALRTCAVKQLEEGESGRPQVSCTSWEPVAEPWRRQGERFCSMNRLRVCVATF